VPLGKIGTTAVTTAVTAAVTTAITNATTTAITTAVTTTSLNKVTALGNKGPEVRLAHLRKGQNKSNDPRATKGLGSVLRT
jgi:hypothetical protein